MIAPGRYTIVSDTLRTSSEAFQALRDTPRSTFRTSALGRGTGRCLHDKQGLRNIKHTCLMQMLQTGGLPDCPNHACLQCCRC
eukprot:362965-Chlamydomonas_euryale.AAC.7